VAEYLRKARKQERFDEFRSQESRKTYESGRQEKFHLENRSWFPGFQI
jgi:hypothetical protein